MALKFGPRQPLKGAPGFTVRKKASPYGAIYSVYKGTAKAGHVQLAKERRRNAPDHCAPEWKALPPPPAGRLPLKDPSRPYRNVRMVWKAHLKPKYRNQGVGKALYRHAMTDQAARPGTTPVVFMPTYCDYGSGTSTDAQRVWRSLKRLKVPGIAVIMPSLWAR